MDIRVELDELQKKCENFDALVAEEGFFNVLKKAQYGKLPPKDCIEICEALVYLSQQH